MRLVTNHLTNTRSLDSGPVPSSRLSYNEVLIELLVEITPNLLTNLQWLLFPDKLFVYTITPAIAKKQGRSTLNSRENKCQQRYIWYLLGLLINMHQNMYKKFNLPLIQPPKLLSFELDMTLYLGWWQIGIRNINKNDPTRIIVNCFHERSAIGWSYQDLSIQLKSMGRFLIIALNCWLPKLTRFSHGASHLLGAHIPSFNPT